jgi:hypothetical protein
VSGNDEGQAASLPNAHKVQLALSDLRQEIRPGLTYPVVLSFERAGDVRVDLPVANPEVPRQDEPSGIKE